MITKKLKQQVVNKIIRLSMPSVHGELPAESLRNIEVEWTSNYWDTILFPKHLLKVFRLRKNATQIDEQKFCVNGVTLRDLCQCVFQLSEGETFKSLTIINAEADSYLMEARFEPIP